jgi:L-fuconolactonase
MIVDTHTHVISCDRVRYPVISEERTDETAWYLDNPVPVEDLLDLMAQSGVGRAVLVQAIGPHGTDNRYVVDAARARSETCVAVGAMDVAGSNPGAELVAMARHGDIRGVRVLDVGGGAFSHPGATAIAHSAAELEIPLLAAILPERLPAVAQLAAEVKDVTVVVDHCGLPPLSTGPPWPDAGGLFALAELPNVVLKVSSMTLQSVPAGEEGSLLEELVARFGADRVMWGSDFPHTCDRSYDELVQLARAAAAGLPTDATETFLGGTALRLWPTLRPTRQPGTPAT